ncbi:MAG: hypothetical protein U0441_01295 [Polyangiaceae bacterium]
MDKRSLGGLILGVLAASSGCAGLLGLDDKHFGEGGGGTSSTGGMTSSGGTTSTGGVTGGTGGVTGGTGGVTGGTGGTGGDGGTTCPEGPSYDVVSDEFDFSPNMCGTTADALHARGWHLAWQEEAGYPIPPFGIGLGIESEALRIGVQSSALFYDGSPGPFIYKSVSGPFLIVTDVEISTVQGSGNLPSIERTGAGILLRDPDSAGTSLERWIAVDRGSDDGSATAHGLWSNWDTGSPDEAVLSDGSAASGKIALCRNAQGGIEVWIRDAGGTWTDASSLIAGAPAGSLPDTLQVGLFLTAYHLPDGDPIADGVVGTFQYVHEYTPNGSCDPTGQGE